MSKLARLSIAVFVVAGTVIAPSAQAIHFYRGPGGGCTPASGQMSDDVAAHGPGGATVMLGHNQYIDSSNATPVTRINAGDSVEWTWNSAHCHSVSFTGFGTKLHYPTAQPTSPRVVPGFFDYPVLETSPTLSYVHTFDTPGTYSYFCEHHAAIGMQGVVIVE